MNFCRTCGVIIDPVDNFDGECVRCAVGLAPLADFKPALELPPTESDWDVFQRLYLDGP